MSVDPEGMGDSPPPPPEKVEGGLCNHSPLEINDSGDNLDQFSWNIVLSRMGHAAPLYDLHVGSSMALYIVDLYHIEL